MTSLLKCDQCGKTVEDDADVDWIVLTRLSESRDFCSWECVAAWIPPR